MSPCELADMRKTLGTEIFFADNRGDYSKIYKDHITETKWRAYNNFIKKSDNEIRHALLKK